MRITESRIRRIIRENDEGTSDFGGEGDYSSWDDVYEILETRMLEETGPGPNGRWVTTGYRPEPGPLPKARTHMMEGNYIDLFSFVAEYLSDRNVKKVVRAPEPDSDERFLQIIRFTNEFESKFPGAADQDKIDRRRLGGPGPNRTQMDSPMLIPIPYFNDFKKVVLTWLTNTLTGEERKIPWPKDMKLSESRIRQIIREETSKILEQIDRHYPDVGDIVTRIIKYEEYNSDESYTGPDPLNPPGIPSNELSSNFARGRHADEMYETLDAMQETGYITFNPKRRMYFLTSKAVEMFVGEEWIGPNVHDLYDTISDLED